MSMLIVALIVVSGIAVVLLLLVFLHNRQNKRRKGKMLRCFSELGSEYNLSFTSLEVIGNRIIGVDGLKGKVLFLENDDDSPIWSVIDLSEAKSCQVKKVYGNLNAGKSSERSTETYLQTITLEFDLKKVIVRLLYPFINT